MWISPNVRLTRRLYPRASCLLLAALFSIAGCANPGPPKPPSLNLPSPVKDLQAERVGEEVRLAWTTPTETTDDIPIKLPITVEVCRDLRTSPTVPKPCTVIQRFAGKSGPSTAVDRLPATLLLDPVQLLSYRVRLVNTSGRAADPSNSAFAAAGAAPDPVVHLHSSASPGGSRIEWTPAKAPEAAVLLERSAVLPPSPQTSPSAPVTPPAGSSPSVHRPSAPVTRLQAASEGSDPGGTLDLTSLRGKTYTYRAWRTRSVTVAGKTLVLRSVESAPLAVTVHDLTPPATPIGLAAVLDGASVDLSWEPNSESDLAGYWIDRTESPDAPANLANSSTGEPVRWHRLNPALVVAPAYRDTLPSGISQVRYRVLAVDTTGNLSLPTTPVSVSSHTSSVP